MTTTQILPQNTSSNTSNITSTTKAILEETSSILEVSQQEILALSLIYSIEPLTNTLVSTLLNELITKLRPTIYRIVSDYVITLRKSILSNEEFVTIAKASSLLNITPATIGSYIAKGILDVYNIDKLRLVSISQIKAIIKSKKDKLKSNKAKNSKYNKPNLGYSMKNYNNPYDKP